MILTSALASSYHIVSLTRDTITPNTERILPNSQKLGVGLSSSPTGLMLFRKEVTAISSCRPWSLTIRKTGSKSAISKTPVAPSRIRCVRHLGSFFQIRPRFYTFDTLSHPAKPSQRKSMQINAMQTIRHRNACVESVEAVGRGNFEPIGRGLRSGAIHVPGAPGAVRAAPHLLMGGSRTT